MPSAEVQLVEALRAIDLPDPSLHAEACAAFESIGIDVPMFSSDPLSRLVQYLREELLPQIRSRQADFDRWVAEKSSDIRDQITAAVKAGVGGVQTLNVASNLYLERMRAEGLAGPETARVVILLATADAIKKVVTNDPGTAFAVLSFSDWLMIALSYIRLKDDLAGPPSRGPNSEAN